MNNLKVSTREMEWGGRKLVLETGKVAKQATGAVVVTYGETKVLATVCAAKEAKADQDFFPLTVNYQEKYYATGKVPGGFMKREGKPSEHEVLVSRLIDRPIRPLFPDAFKNEVQIICTTLCHDQKTTSDVVAMIAASAALAVSGIPFMGPIGAAKVGYKNGEFILNPTIDEQKESELELTVAGTKEGVLMVESEANELSEETMLNAVMFGFDSFQPVIDMICELAKEAGKEPWETPVFPKEFDEMYERIAKAFRSRYEEAFTETDKLKRGTLIGQLDEEVKAGIDPENEIENKYLLDVLEKLKHVVVREKVLSTGKRIDGRDTKTVRPIWCEVDVLPTAHGSAIFTRGETQGAGGYHPRHRRRRADCRRFDERIQRRLYAQLQLPAVFGRRMRPSGQPGTPRNRPRQTGLARHPSDDAQRQGRFPLHHPGRIRNFGIERFFFDGHRLRHHHVTDGCRRADGQTGCRYCHGLDQRRRRPGCHPHRHFG